MMNFEAVQAYCRAIVGTTEDLKWGCHPTFCVGDKIYAIVGIDSPVNITLKSTPELFEILTQQEGIIPAPYLARSKWINVSLGTAVDDATLKELIDESYRLVFAKLTKKKRTSITESVA